MRNKSLFRIATVVVVTAALSVLALLGAPLGTSKYYLKPLFDAIPQGLDLRGGIYAVYEAVNPNEEDFAQKLEATQKALRSRLTEKGFTEATISQQGADRIRVEIPDVADPEEILKIVGSPAKLLFKEPDGTVVMEGKSIQYAEPRASTDGGWEVAFQLDPEGTDKFAEATARLQGQSISIELDGVEKSRPTVNSAIPNGQGTITTGSQTEAEDLAMLIQSGSLPMEITQIEVRTISATLGVDALQRGVLAGIIGFCLILLFMLFFYRMQGLMADIALCVYVLLMFFFLAIVPGVQLTLPGIAGIILSIGMAVDANVIIFERVKDELRDGKSVRSSVEAGFKNALRAIIDSNVTTLIAGFVLLSFGTGSIKGFAMTLIVGVLTSMITAIFVSRFLMRNLVNITQKKALYGVKNVKGGASA